MGGIARDSPLPSPHSIRYNGGKFGGETNQEAQGSGYFCF